MRERAEQPHLRARARRARARALARSLALTLAGGLNHEVHFATLHYSQRLYPIA